jgi:phosphoglycolate phosphatase-like HAD superfamily hydrolase
MRPLPGAARLLRATVQLGLKVVLTTSAKDDEVDLMLDAPIAHPGGLPRHDPAVML